MAASVTKTGGRSIGSIFGSIGVLILVGAAFVTGLLGAVYLSLRSPEVAVPEVVGKDQYAGREMLEDEGLSMRVRSERFAANARPNTILDQSPGAGEVVKAGQTIAVVVARAEAREGEAAVTTVSPAPNAENSNNQESQNEGGTAAANTKRDANKNATADRKAERERAANKTRDAAANRNANRNSNSGAARNTGNNANRPAASNSNNRSNNVARPTPAPAANQTRGRTTTTTTPAANSNRQP